MKTWNKTITLLRNDVQEVVANGYLDLCGVLDRPIEVLDGQMRHKRLEEELDMPAFTILLHNGQQVFKREVISQELVGPPVLKVLIQNKSKGV